MPAKMVESWAPAAQSADDNKPGGRPAKIMIIGGAAGVRSNIAFI